MKRTGIGSRRWTVPLALAAALWAAGAREARAGQPGKTEFERANRYFEAEEYEAALPYYRKAYELSSHRPSTIRQLAQCERALKKYDDAIVHFQEYLATNPEDAPKIRETLALVEDLRNEARKQAQATPPPQPATPPLASTASKTVPEPTGTTKPAPEGETTAGTPNLGASPAPRSDLVETTTEAPKEESSSVFSSPVFWGIVAGVAVLGAGIAIGVALSGTESPYPGTTGVILRR